MRDDDHPYGIVVERTCRDCGRLVKWVEVIGGSLTYTGFGWSRGYWRHVAERRVAEPVPADVP